MNNLWLIGVAMVALGYGLAWSGSDLTAKVIGAVSLLVGMGVLLGAAL